MSIEAANEIMLPDVDEMKKNKMNINIDKMSNDTNNNEISVLGTFIVGIVHAFIIAWFDGVNGLIFDGVNGVVFVGANGEINGWFKGDCNFGKLLNR